MRAVAVVLVLMLGACTDGPNRSEDMARRRVLASYPGGVISLVRHELPADEVVVCGYARSREDPSPNAFVWRRGYLMSPDEVAAMDAPRLTRLCGPDYVAPRADPPSDDAPTS